MLYRKQLRALYPAGTEVTSKLLSIASDALAFPLTTATQHLYLGFHQRFFSRYFIMGTANVTAATLTVQYWNGTTWTAVDELQDRTAAFTANGWIGWTLADDNTWSKSVQSPVDDELYWVRISTGTTLHAATTLQAVLNLFCDDVLLRTWYPEMVSDTRYLPSGRNDFYEQYNAAKEMVVQELIRMEAINEESQILDIAEVGVPTAHAAAYCILNGIPNLTEAQIARRDKMHEDMMFWLNKSRFSFDVDDSGTLSDSEDETGPRYIPRGGF